MSDTPTPEQEPGPQSPAAEAARQDPLAEAQAALTARKDAILVAMLPDVAFDGWTSTTLRRGAEAAGFHPQEALASFPGGPVEAVCWFSTWADRQMQAALADTDLTALKVRERVTLAVRKRLEILTPHREAVRRASSLLALPQNAARGPQLVYATVDAAWRAVGDKSVDYNFYTKRLLLAGVVTATTLYWLDDRSDELSDSWAFLDRRIANVMSVGKAIGQVTGRADKAAGLLAHLPSPARFLRRLRGASAA
ncbi:ubiquinone biosynthesis protein [Niveispirillum lacus]|uniref:Ubiquinone biosynthesis protein n=1 Tax=Niveispirillum lacus TaxID=1981099 RepID=A0A255Z020_9PROT|nr:COQ9 family protein [Niveispirillum lacus]OYQ34769.1 ubiquinone biosynthesis protein [Niveispirillum lacus]